MSRRSGAADRGGVRLHKALADAGLASRRVAESWIAAGRLEINGRPATIGIRVLPGDRVRLDGRPLRLFRRADPPQVLVYKKRVGELVTTRDPEGRRTVFRKLPPLAGGRWIAVGRLDANTSGLLLLTNHGELARRLMHPSFGLERVYAVRVLGTIDHALLNRLARGVVLDDGPARFERIEAMDVFGGTSRFEIEPESGSRQAPGEGARRATRGRDEPPDRGRAAGVDAGPSANRWLRVVVREGRNRLVRRMFASQGLTVSRLIRIGYGPIALGGGIRSGSYRRLEADEVQALFKAVDLAPERPRRGWSARGR